MNETNQSVPRELTNANLVERAVRNATKPGVPKWVAVVDVFGVGSTAAKFLCTEFGFDPYAPANTAKTEQPWGAAEQMT